MESKAPATVTSSRLIVLASLLYFAEGFPYGLINELFPIYLRERGIDRGEIGMALSSVGLAWTLKFLWAPIVDRFGRYRHWISGALLVMAFSGLALAASPRSQAVIILLLTILAVASATQDIAADGFTIVVTPNEKIGRVNAVRIAAYRIALIVSGGGLAAAATFFGWRVAFAIATTMLLLLAAFAYLALGERRTERTGSDLATDLRRWIARPGLLALIVPILLYRFGDSALRPMIKVFWVDSGYQAAEIGTVTTTIGISFTILGGIVGGIVVEKLGIYRALLTLGIAQAASNAGYALAASFGATRAVMYPAAIVETFCEGLGITALLAFLMMLSDRKHAATDYALYSAIFGLGRSLAGSVSGYGVNALGYTTFFWITLALALPGLLSVWLMRRRIEEAAEAHA